jgi:hypothetical protein
VVIANEELICEDRSEHLSAIVVEATMPNVLIQIEQPFEPIVERFHGLASPCIQSFGSTAPEVLSTLKSPPMWLVTRRRNCRLCLSFAAATILGTKKTPTGSPIIFVVLDPLGNPVAVITAIGQHAVCFLGKIADFFVEGLRFLRAGGIDRSQPWENGAASRGADDHLKTVALHPAIVLRTAPSAFLIDSMKPFGDAACLSITLMPPWASGSHQAFVYGNNLRIGHAFRDGFFTLQRNGCAKQMVCSSIPTKKRAPRGEAFPSGSLSNQPSVRFIRDETKLGRFALLVFEHSDHNQQSYEPIRDVGLGSRPRPWTLAFGFPQQWDGHFHQRLQARACRGTFSHPWDLQGLPFPCGKRNITTGVPCA